MNKINLEKLGLTESFSVESELYENLYVGRVISQAKGLYKIMCENGELLSEVSGKFRYDTKTLSDFPAVGDFVMIDRDTTERGNAIIHHVLSRRSAFIRKAAGTANNEQVIATNIDTVFICMSLNNDFNIRRLERYLSVAWDSGAVPVIVLTKADLAEDIESMLDEVDSIAIGTDVLVTNAMSDDGYKQILSYIKEGKTIALIGSSGVGKTTIINSLTGASFETKGLRNDDRGKHTTTSRELILLENGGLIIDTPGMRELGLESVDLSKSFSDIEELSYQCKFHDCKHNREPGCAVQDAIHNGELDEERFISYRKLKKEAKYDGLNSKQIETMKLNEMFSEVGGMKNARKFVKNKKKRR